MRLDLETLSVYIQSAVRTPLALTTLVLLAACRAEVPPGAGGAEIYELQNCANCHGVNLDGNQGRDAPPLAGLDRHWSAEELALFLQDPARYPSKTARMRVIESRYSRSMPPYPNLTDDERLTLARWLIARSSE